MTFVSVLVPDDRGDFEVKVVSLGFSVGELVKIPEAKNEVIYQKKYDINQPLMIVLYVLHLSN